MPLPGEWILFDAHQARGVHDASRKRFLATDGNHGSVNVYDMEERELARIIQVGGAPHGIALHPDGDRAYVTDREGDRVVVIDVGSLLLDVTASPVLGEIAVGDDPYAVVFSPDGASAYVANYASGGGEPSVSVIDAALDELAQTLTLTHLDAVSAPAERRPTALLLSDDGLHLYVAHTGYHYDFDELEMQPGRHVSRFTFDSSSPRASVVDVTVAEVGRTPISLQLVGESGPDERLYVVCNGNRSLFYDGALYVVAPNLSTSVAVDVGVAPAALLIDQEGGRGYVSHLELDANVPAFTGSITVVDLMADAALPGEVDVGIASAALAMDGARKRVFVAAWGGVTNGSGSSVRWFNTSEVDSGMVDIHDLDDVRQPCRAMMIGKAEGYVVHPSSLSVFDPGTGKLLASVAARGPGPLDLAWVPGAGAVPDRLYASLPGDDRVVALDVPSVSPGGAGPTPVALPLPWPGGRPSDLLWSEATGRLFAAAAGTTGLAEGRLEVWQVDASTPTYVGTMELPLTGPVALAEGAATTVHVAGFGALEFGTSSYSGAVAAQVTDGGQSPPAQTALSFEAFGMLDLDATSDGALVIYASYLGTDSGDNFDTEPGAVVVGGADVAAVFPNVLELSGTNRPLRIALRNGDDRAYALTAGGDRLQVVELAQALVFSDPFEAFLGGSIDLIPGAFAGGRVLRMPLDETDTRVFVPCFDADALVVVQDDSVVGELAVGDGPIDVTVVGAGTAARAYVCNFLDNSVSVVDPGGTAAPALVAVGRGPVRALASPDGERVFVANSLDRSVSVIHTATLAVDTVVLNTSP